MNENVKIDLNRERFQVIQEWCILNFPSISNYIKVKIKNRQITNTMLSSSNIQFETERKDAHEQLKYNLVSYRNKIQRFISSFEISLNNLVSQPIPPLGKIYYSQRKMNLNVRNLLFINQLIHKLKIKIFTLRIDAMFLITKKINKALELVEKSPSDAIIIISKQFFEMELNKEKCQNQSKAVDQASSGLSSSSGHDNIPIRNRSSSGLLDSSSTPSFNSLFNINDNGNNSLSIDSSLTLFFGSSPIQIEPTIKQYESIMIRLISYSDHLSSIITNAYPKPLWVKDYSLYLDKIVTNSLSRFDSELSYLLPQECEVSLSRFFFSNYIKSSEPIDVILRSFCKIAPNAFMIELMNMCFKLVPTKLLNEFKPEKLSICLTFMYRLLIDRVYEKSFAEGKDCISKVKEKMIQMVNSYNEKQSKYLMMKKLPISAFVWPREYIPRHPVVNGYNYKKDAMANNRTINNTNNDDGNKSNKIDNNINNNITDNSNKNMDNDQNINDSTSMNNYSQKNNDNSNCNRVSHINDSNMHNENNNYIDENCLEMPIREFFRSDFYFLPAIEFLELSIFCTNPIDSLYYIHKCLISVQKAAIIHSINKRKNRQASPSELNQVICFDDLFGLTLGVFLASDVPDIFALNWFVQNYSPHNELSPPLEYAKANLEGLTQHIATVEFKSNV